MKSKVSHKRFPRRPALESGEFLWLVSLSDLMMLLFILFVVLFSFTYKKLKESDIKRIVATLRNEPPPTNPIEQIKDRMAGWIEEQKLSDRVNLETKEDAVLMQIKDKVLFSSGEFAIHPEGLVMLHSLSKMLEKIPEPYRLGIEGHTDNVPVYAKNIRDNWELSTKRALAVLYGLILPTEVLKRTVVMGHGDTKPIAPNQDTAGKPIPENQSKNRRVTFHIF